MSYLKAEWRKLAFANYAIDKEYLTEFIPFGTELDVWNGKCFVSLVGFMFINTRLLGIKVPYHIDFEEVNLRFYVKRFENGEWKRGVVFIKEIVPKRALTFVANTIYKENYETLPMRHSWSEKEDSRVVEYNWTKFGKENSFQLTASKESFEIPSESETEFITEHYWGYAKVNDKKSHEYQVKHPKWKTYKVKQHKIDVDFGSVYGEKFSFLTTMEPHSLMLAEGSGISVENKKTISK
jgi:hypothetical protein